MTVDELIRTRGRGLRGVLVELGFVASALAADLLVRRYTLDEGGTAAANADDLAALQRALGLDWERTVQDLTLGFGWFADLCSFFYVWGYFPVVLTAMVGLYGLRPTAYARLRNALLATGVIGLLFYAFYPTAPPRLTGSGYVDTVTSVGLDSAARPAGLANEIAAIPSFHIAWLVVVAVVVYQSTRSPLLRVACVLEPTFMAWAVVATGNHWVLDIPAGVVLAAVGLYLADSLPLSRPGSDRRRAPAGAGRASGTSQSSGHRDPVGRDTGPSTVDPWKSHS